MRRAARFQGFRGGDIDPEEAITKGHEALEEIRRELLAYVAKYYQHPSTVVEFVCGTHTDPEYIWDQALDDVLGPDIRTADLNRVTEKDGEKIERTAFALMAVCHLWKEEALRVQNEERLFGRAEAPKPFSPGWTASHALEVMDGGMWQIVATYLSNVVGGLIDATGMFDALDDNE